MSSTFKNENQHCEEILDHEDTQAFNLLFNNLEVQSSDGNSDIDFTKRLTTGLIASIVFQYTRTKKNPSYLCIIVLQTINP